MPKNLLIVESPAKAKTIEKYLGKDFAVKSSYGHIRDLDKGNKGVDVEKDLQPNYIVPQDKQKVVKDLKGWTKKSDVVWLATDEDREGEAISWHLCQVLGLDVHTTKRIVFREITKPAIQKAIESPRTVDIDLVNAQQARRVLDRLVGYELSPVLWKKIKTGLSAGRVQSVAVKLIVQREREIQGFESTAYFRIQGLFFGESSKGQPFKAAFNRRVDGYDEALSILNACATSEFSITDVETKPAQKKPSAPFITSTLQQEASRKLSFSVKRTMSVAQKLYEKGLITYMRTDSTNLSSLAVENIAKEITRSYGEEYLQTRQYSSKSKGAQEAHEAIRPTYIERQDVSSDRDEQRLYELIWKRTIASQMANAKLERTKAKIGVSGLDTDYFVAKGEVLKFDGFLKVYIESTDDDDAEETAGILPKLTVGQVLEMKSIEGTERFTNPPARFTEATLVKKLEELGIGRPSTYAPTISKIMEEKRGYITKESRPGHERKYRTLSVEKGQDVKKETETEITGATSNRLYPSDLGMLVTDFLVEHFEEIMDYHFTAGVEEKFDTIAEGHLDWHQMIKDFYGEFKKDVEGVIENAERTRGRRVLGTDEKTGHTILTQLTRFGPVVQIGTAEEVGEDEKPQFANLKPGQSIETITLEEALDLFVLPKTLGELDGREVIIGSGRYGPYIKYDEGFVNIPKSDDPLELSLERATELIRAKQKENEPIGTYKGKPITKGKGRFGPYFKWDGMFVNIPKRFDPETISLDEAYELIQKKAEKEANRYINRWEKEKISVENGRWGPFIRKGRKSIRIPQMNGNKISSEQAKELTLEDVQTIIKGDVPERLKKLLAKEASES